MKIGIFGGTFDPIHNGHLYIADNARKLQNLDRVIFVPTANPPHKQNKLITTPASRLEMCTLAIANNEYFEVSDIEVNRPGLSYTITTLNELKASYGTRVQLYFICGADMLGDIPSWYLAQEIVANYHIIAFPRPGFDMKSIVQQQQLLKEHSNNLILLDIMAVEISATLVRNSIKAGNSVKYLIPDQVIEYIQLHDLYSGRIRK